MAILSPTPGSSFIESTTVTFEGSAVDPAGGVLADNALAWSSSVDGPLGRGASFTRSDLSPGTHAIRLVGINERGLADTASVNLIIAENQAPAAVITSPAPGSSFSESETITFSGTASDQEDGTLEGAVLVWTSSVDGGIGTGDSFTRDDLTPGTHTIRLVGTDAHGEADTASLSITIAPNQVPAAAIISPAPGSTHVEGDAVAFSGTVTDPEDGALGGEALVWISSRDGQIGTGTSFNRTDLSLGTHTIRLAGTDARGASDTASVSITVATNQAPSVSITAPPAGASFTEGEAVTFSGAGSDPEDGALSGGALVWTSGRDGQIGTGASFSRSDLSTGAHTIRLVGIDSRGAADTAVVNVTIATPAPPPNQPPAVTITSPYPGSSHSHGAVIDFSGTASDPEDGALAGGAVVWTSSLDGQLGTGTSFSRSDLTTGTHTIRLLATDSEGDSTAVTVTVTVQPPVDTAPPELLGFSFSPDSVDVTQGSVTIVFSIDARDTDTGIARLQVRLLSPGGNQRVEGVLLKDTVRSGTWALNMVMPAGVEAGEYSVRSVDLRDLAGNEVVVEEASLAAAGYPTKVTVTSANPDTLAPRLTAFSFTPASVNLSRGSATVEFDVGAEDADAGVFDVRVRLIGPGGVQRSAAASTPVSGTPNAGIWRVSVSFPAESEAGEYRVSIVEIWDRAGNARFVSGSELAAAGFPTTVRVTTGEAG